MATDSPSDPMGLDAHVGLLRSGLGGTADEDAAAVPAAALIAIDADAGEGSVDAAVARSPVTGSATGGGESIRARFLILGAEQMGSRGIER